APTIHWVFRRGLPDRLAGRAAGSLVWRFDLQGGVGVSSGRRDDEEYWRGSYHIGFFPSGPLVRIELWFHHIQDRIIDLQEAREEGTDVSLRGRFFHDDQGVGLVFDGSAEGLRLGSHQVSTLRFVPEW